MKIRRMTIIFVANFLVLSFFIGFFWFLKTREASANISNNKAPDTLTIFQLQTQTPTATNTSTSTSTSTNTITPIPTTTPTSTTIQTSTPTETSTSTSTATGTPISTNTNTPTPTEISRDHFVFLPQVLRVRVLEPTPTPTATNTITPKPTNTIIPSITPAPTQTSLPPGLYILPNHSFYETSWGSLHIVGEVMNNTNNHLFWVEVYVNLFNQYGELLATDYGFVALDNLPSGVKSCFHVIILDAPEGWSYYEFEPPTYGWIGDQLPNLTVLNDSGHYDPDDGDYWIVGQVRNDHGIRVEYVMPVGTLYNSSGTVVGCDYTYVNSTHLDPGQISAFQIDYYGRDYAGVTSYRIQVDGDTE